MLGFKWSSMAALDMDIRAVEVVGESKEEDTDEAAVQAAAKAEEEKDHKTSRSRHSSRKKENRHMHSQMPKRDQQEAVSTARETTTSVSALNSPKIKFTDFYPNPGGGGQWKWW